MSNLFLVRGSVHFQQNQLFFLWDEVHSSRTSENIFQLYSHATSWIILKFWALSISTSVKLKNNILVIEIDSIANRHVKIIVNTDSKKIDK